MPDQSAPITRSIEQVADPVNAVTVLRAKLDAWLAEKCEEAGAMIMPGVRVDRVLTEGTRVVGVRAWTVERVGEVRGDGAGEVRPVRLAHGRRQRSAASARPTYLCATPERSFFAR